MKQRFFCLIVAISFTLTPSVFALNAQRGLSVVPDSSTWGNYHALIIGINDYNKWPRLRTAVKDATVIRDTLITRYGFPKKNVILRTDGAATRFQIERDIRYLATAMKSVDNLFIYYAGHGQLDDLTGDGYWVPVEGALKNPSTWVANSYLKAVLSSEKVQAKNIVVIADSCYSGSMLRGGPSLMSLDDKRYQEKLVQKAALRSRQVISSGGVEPVADGGAEGHSLFAYYLIDALRTNEREVVDLENLFHTKVWKPVTEIGDQRPNVGRLKTPMDQDGQFVLYNAALVLQQKVSKPQIGSKPGAAIPATAAPQAAPRNLNDEEELWNIVKTSPAVEDYEMFLEAYPNSRFEIHARLKMQQIKRKKSAKKMAAAVTPKPVKPKPVEPKTVSGSKAAKKSLTYAAVSPTLIEQSSGVRLKERKSKYRLALFPIKYQSTYGSQGSTVELGSIKGINELAANDQNLTLAYTYKKLKGSPDDVTLFPGDELPQVWKKKSFFAASEPDWDKVKTFGSQIDAEIAILVSAVFRNGVFRLDIYCYDYNSGNVYSTLNQEASSWGMSTAVENAARRVVRELYGNE